MPHRVFTGVLLLLALLAGACGSGDADVDQAESAAVGDDESGAGDTSSDDSVDGDDAPAALAWSAPALDMFDTSIGSSGNLEGVVASPDPDNPSVRLEMKVTGSYNERTRRARLTADLSEAAEIAFGDEAGVAGLDMFFADPMEVVVVGDEAWLQWPLLTMLAGGGQESWLTMSEDLGSISGDFGFESGPPDPMAILADLVAVNPDTVFVGLGDVRGVATEHWRTDVLLGSDDTDITHQLDLWIGSSDRLLYRFELTPLDPSADEPPIAEAMIWFELFDHGIPVSVSRPPTDQILSPDAFSFGD